MKDLDYYADCYERYLDSIGDNSLTLEEEVRELSWEVRDLTYALRQVLTLLDANETRDVVAEYVREVLEEG